MLLTLNWCSGHCTEPTCIGSENMAQHHLQLLPPACPSSQLASTQQTFPEHLLCADPVLGPRESEVTGGGRGGLVKGGYDSPR